MNRGPGRSCCGGFVLAGVGIVLAVSSGAPRAQSFAYVDSPSRDNSMWEESGSLSNGSGTHLFAGRTSFGTARRALVHFDVSAVPNGATVSVPLLELTCTLSPPLPAPQVFTLHRLTADWGEAGSDAGEPGGTGAAAAAGDVTWTDRFFLQGAPWGSPGGDFVAAASSTSAAVAACNPASPVTVAFPATPQLTADIQGWVDDPSTNFGWIVVGNETEFTTARRFESREAATGQPQLSFKYSEPPTNTPATSGWGLLALTIGLLGIASAILLRRRARALSC